MDRELFEQMYQGQAPWDTGRPQPAVVFARQFDTVIDCGLFHTFTDEERLVFVAGLGTVLRSRGWLYVLCFSDEEPGTEGPRRVTQQEIRDAFRNGWQVKRIEPTQFESADVPGRPAFSPGGPKAWLATIERS